VDNPSAPDEKERPMSKEVARPTGPLADMMEWFDTGVPRALRGLGLSPVVRVEDFVKDNTYVLRAEMPGLDPDEDVAVTVQGDVLTIAGERREEKRERNRQEFHYGSFHRSVTLPPGADPDQIDASYTDGVLEVRVPVDTKQSSAVTVPVKRS